MPTNSNSISYKQLHINKAIFKDHSRQFMDPIVYVTQGQETPDIQKQQ